MNELDRGGKVVGGTDRRGLAHSYRCCSLLFYEIGRGRMTAMLGQNWLHGMKCWLLAALQMGDEQSQLSSVFGSTPSALLRVAPVSWGKMSPSYQLSACSLHLCLIQTSICILSNSYPNFMA